MANVTVHFRDGTHKEFKHEGRAGGSYTKTVIHKDGWVIVEDEWGNRTSYPSDIVEHVEERSHR